MLADLWGHCDNALIAGLDMGTAWVDKGIGMEQMMFRPRGKVGCIAVDRH